MLPTKQSKKNSKTFEVYQIKVTLRDSKPPIWRRIQVRSDTNLRTLHDILQVAMGWTDSHLHQFTAGGFDYGRPEADIFGFGLEVKDEKKYRLDQLVSTEGAKINYDYDFGDSWQHTLLIEKILPPEEGVSYPVCVKGKRACPPEDCGGIWGYQELLEAVKDPDHPQHGDMLEWVDEEFDPEEFDLDAVNRELRSLR